MVTTCAAQVKMCWWGKRSTSTLFLRAGAANNQFRDQRRSPREVDAGARRTVAGSTRADLARLTARGCPCPIGFGKWAAPNTITTRTVLHGGSTTFRQDASYGQIRAAREWLVPESRRATDSGAALQGGVVAGRQSARLFAVYVPAEYADSAHQLTGRTAPR